MAGSNIGGMKETQEMIDFAGKHNITADVEVVPMDYVNTKHCIGATGESRCQVPLRDRHWQHAESCLGQGS